MLVQHAQPQRPPQRPTIIQLQPQPQRPQTNKKVFFEDVKYSFYEMMHSVECIICFEETKKNKIIKTTCCSQEICCECTKQLFSYSCKNNLCVSCPYCRKPINKLLISSTGFNDEMKKIALNQTLLQPKK